jgi:dienelactone hydrolase
MASVLGMPVHAPAQAGRQPPVEAFFQHAEIAGVSISHDGRRLSLLSAAQGKRPGIAIVDLADMKPRSIARYDHVDVDQVSWLTDERLSFHVGNTSGDVQYASGLFAINADGTGTRGVIVTAPPKRSFTGADCGSCVPRGFDPLVIDWQGSSAHVFAKVVYLDSNDESSMTKFNTRHGTQLEVDIPDGSHQWLVDSNEQVRVAMSRVGDQMTLHYRGSKGSWRRVTSFRADSAAAFTPLLFVDNTLFVLATQGGERTAVYRYDLEKAALDPAPLLASAEFDMKPDWTSDGKKLLGLRARADKEHNHWFDAQMKKLQEEVDAALPNTFNLISRGSRSQTPFVLVRSYSATQPSVYHVFDAATKRMTQLAESRSRIDSAAMARKEFVRYPARDGLQIPAYLTLPRHSAGKNLPTVVLVGDNPWERNGDSDWSATVQFLASRGYAVIEPDARGAMGFGNAHHQAGIGQWGLAMQDDLADGARWAVAKGIADPKRICILGGSYGGYAAMMGVIRDPDVFRCAASWSGIADLAPLFAPNRDARRSTDDLRKLRVVLGNPATEKQAFAERSPLHQAARIKAPVLLAYGARDVHVPAAEGEALATAIRAGGNQNVEFHMYDKQGQLPVADNRIDLWSRIEKFLEKHNGPVQ